MSTPQDWLRVTTAGELSAAGRMVLEVAGTQILLLHLASGPVAVRNRCTHLGKPLDRGRVIAGRLHCPHHDACFDLSSGAALSGPAVARLAVYPARIEGGEVFIRMQTE